MDAETRVQPDGAGPPEPPRARHARDSAVFTADTLVIGKDDDEIVGVEQSDPRLETIRTLDDLPPHRLKEIESFFNTYKDLEGKQTEIIGWQDRAAVLPLIAQCRQAYQGCGAETTTWREVAYPREQNT